MADTKPTQEQVLDSFKKSLDDVAVVIEKLAPHCQSFDEMVGMLKLAEENGGQLRLLYRIVTDQKK